MVPTTRLPRIRSIPLQSTKDLAEALEYLRQLYQPPVRGCRRRRRIDVAIEDQERIRLDPFERNFTLRWLTALISHLETQTDAEPYESLIQHAASILALCSGTAGAGTFHRDFVFTSAYIPSCSVTVRIKDIPLDNQDYASVGAQTWGGACVLAESIVDEPWKFGLCESEDNLTSTSTIPLRILELGAGTGLVSLTIGKLFQNLSRPVTLIATDYYPPVLENLSSNITANSISMTSHHLDWSTYASMSSTQPKPFDVPFDIIFGADIVYELEHAKWIKSCLSVLLRKQPSAAFHLVIPLRSTHDEETKTIELVFKGELSILWKEEIICETEEGGEEVNYVYYKIGWNVT